MDLDHALALLAHDPAAPLDIAELALLFARDEYTNLDIDAYLSELDSMAREARGYVRGDLTARVSGLCRYLFHEMGFRGNQREYYDPRNSYLNKVLDRRTGIPISLSVLAMAVGQRAGLQVQGVGLPGHFIVKATAAGEEILFDPFHGGRRLEPTDCETLVHQLTGVSFQATAEVLQGLPLHLVALRLLNNLKAIYFQQQDFPRAVRVISRLRQLAPDDLLQRRDLGISLLQAGKPGQAIDHLSAYLQAVPGDSESAAIAGLLERARRDVSQWN